MRALRLRRETLRELAAGELASVAGAAATLTCSLRVACVITAHCYTYDCPTVHDCR